MKLKFAALTTATIVLLGLTGCGKSETKLVKDSSTPIPNEKLGLDGKYDPSGLAKRVVAALEENKTLGDKPTVYVAQDGNIIILKGSSDRATLKEIVSVANKVEGVLKVDTSKVKTR